MTSGDLAGVSFQVWAVEEWPWERPDMHMSDQPLLEHDQHQLVKVTVGKRIGSACPILGTLSNSHFHKLKLIVPQQRLITHVRVWSLPGLGMGLANMFKNRPRLLLVPNPFGRDGNNSHNLL